MDFVNVLKNELFRPVATLIVPGSLAFFPYALLIANINPGVVSVWEGHNGVVVTMFLMVALALGMVIENIGSLIEILIDGVLGDEHINRWREYLGLRVQDEIIGQRYLRTLVLRLKFELSALVAIPISYLGFLLLNQVSGYWSFFSMIIAAICVFVGMIYLVYETYKSSKALDSTRKVIIESQNRFEVSQISDSHT